MTADELSKLLDELGKRLGPAGSHVFELAVRQVYIGAAMNILLAAVAAVLVVVGLVIYSRIRRRRWAKWDALPEREKEYPSLNDRPSEMELGLIALGFGAAIFGCALLASSALTSFLNPEYAAIRDLLRAVSR